MFENDCNWPAVFDQATLSENIGGKIIVELEEGHFPWLPLPQGKAKVKAPLALRRNVATRRHHTRINELNLLGAVIQHGFPGHSWLTFLQAQSLEGNVSRGERGTVFTPFDNLAEGNPYDAYLPPDPEDPEWQALPKTGDAP